MYFHAALKKSWKILFNISVLTAASLSIGCEETAERTFTDPRGNTILEKDLRARCFDLRHLPYQNESYELRVGGKEYPLVPIDDARLARHQAATTAEERQIESPTHCVENVELPFHRASLATVMQVTDNTGLIAQAHGPNVKEAMVLMSFLFNDDRLLPKQGLIAQTKSTLSGWAQVLKRNNPLAQTVNPDPNQCPSITDSSPPKQCGQPLKSPDPIGLNIVDAADLCASSVMHHPDIYHKQNCGSVFQASYNYATNLTGMTPCRILVKSQGAGSGSSFADYANVFTITQATVNGLQLQNLKNCASASTVKPTTASFVTYDPSNVSACTNITSTSTPAASSTLSATNTVEHWAWTPGFQQVVAPLMLEAVKQANNDVNNLCYFYHNKAGVSSTTSTASSSLALTAAGDDSYTWSHVSPEKGASCDFVKATPNGASTTIEIECKNWYERYLGIYYTFLDDNGNPVSGPANCKDGQGTNSNENCYAEILSSIESILGVPTFADPATQSFEVEMPAGATSIKITLGGLGATGPFNAHNVLIGNILTSSINRALPSAMLALGALLPSGVLYPLIKNIGAKIVEEAIGASLKAANSQSNTSVTSDSDSAELAKEISLKILNFLLNPTLIRIGIMVMYDVEADDIIKVVPIAGWVFEAAAVATESAQVAISIGEAASSPWQYEYILQRTHNIALTVYRDEDDIELPASAAYYTAVAQFSQSDLRYPDGYSAASPIITYPGHLSSVLVTWSNVPAGGAVTLTVVFYNSEGTIVGRGVLDIPNNANSDISPDMTIVEYLVPLNASTIYQHENILSYSGGYSWTSSSTTPAALTSRLTLGDLSLAQSQPSNAGKPMSSGSLNPPYVNLPSPPPALLPWQLGYSWGAPCQSNSCATNQYFYNVLPIVTGTATASGGPQGQLTVALPAELKAVNEGYTIQPYNSIYALYAFGSSSPIATFPAIVQQFLVHPANFIFALDTINSKMYKVALSTNSASLNPFPATQFGGEGTAAVADYNYGLLFSPVAMDVSKKDGSIIVLEHYVDGSAAHARLHAFATSTLTSAYFSANSASSCPSSAPASTGGQGGAEGKFYTLELCTTPGATYLDIAIESKGFIYILYVSDNAGMVDLYDDNYKYITTFKNINAGQIAVDVWRNMYTLNHATITGQSGIEPSMSQWSPLTSPTK